MIMTKIKLFIAAPLSLLRAALCLAMSFIPKAYNAAANIIGMAVSGWVWVLLLLEQYVALTILWLEGDNGGDE
jgi:hypothetical protein